MPHTMTFISRRRQWFFLSLCLSLVALGCSGSSGPKLPTFSEDAVPVSGTVTMDGQPLADAAVTFLFDGTAPKGFMSGSGKTDSSGKYALTSGAKPGVPAGRYRVSISKLATKDGTPFREDPAAGIDLEQARISGQIREGVPKQYSDPEKTTLSAQITTTQSEPVNFTLKSK